MKSLPSSPKTRLRPAPAESRLVELVVAPVVGVFVVHRFVSDDDECAVSLLEQAVARPRRDMSANAERYVGREQRQQAAIFQLFDWSRRSHRVTPLQLLILSLPMVPNPGTIADVLLV